MKTSQFWKNRTNISNIFCTITLFFIKSLNLWVTWPVHLKKDAAICDKTDPFLTVNKITEMRNGLNVVLAQSRLEILGQLWDVAGPLQTL